MEGTSTPTETEKFTFSTDWTFSREITSLIFAAFSGATAAAVGAEAAAFCVEVCPFLASPVFAAPADGGGLELLEAAGGVAGTVDGLVSALLFAGDEGVGCADVAPDLVGVSFVSLDAFAGADFSWGVEVLDFAAGALISDSVFEVGLFSWGDLEGLSGCLVSEAAFEGDFGSVADPVLGFAALGCSTSF